MLDCLLALVAKYNIRRVQLKCSALPLLIVIVSLILQKLVACSCAASHLAVCSVYILRFSFATGLPLCCAVFLAWFELSTASLPQFNLMSLRSVWTFCYCVGRTCKTHGRLLLDCMVWLWCVGCPVVCAWLSGCRISELSVCVHLLCDLYMWNKILPNVLRSILWFSVSYPLT